MTKEKVSYPTLNLKVYQKPGVMVQAFNTSTREAETGGSLWVQGQPDLYIARLSQDSHDYTKKLCIKKQNKQKNKAKLG